MTATAIPIERRDAREVTHISGWTAKTARREEVRLTPEDSPAANFAFDVTPARLVSGARHRAWRLRRHRAMDCSSLFPERRARGAA
jgi:methylthioribose-1-phosphate isomerase